jgi:hypothetical protein
MGRSASSIQTEITTLETYLASADSMVLGVGSDGTNITRARRSEIEQRLDMLYQQLERANGTAPMFVRGRIKGM